VEARERSLFIVSSPENLAKLSFKLAQAFESVQDDLNAENLPKNPTFKLGAEDVAELRTVDEDVRFMLPKKIRTELSARG
jgi:hypothetical protein